jgi:hypothetical protein
VGGCLANNKLGKEIDFVVEIPIVNEDLVED